MPVLCHASSQLFFLLAIVIRIVIILQSIMFQTLGNLNLYQDVILQLRIVQKMLSFA